MIVLSACGSQPNTVTVKKQVAPSPQRVVLASVQATTAAKSARISMNVSTDGTGAQGYALTGDGVSDFITGDGALTMQFSGPVAKFLRAGVEFRTVDGFGYLKMPELLGALPGGDKWLKMPDLGTGGVVPGAGQSDPTQFLAYLETVSSNVTKVGSETIRGVVTTHYHASLDLGKAVDQAKVPASLRDDLHKLLHTKSGSTIPADVWVDGDGLARRIQVEIDVGTTFSIAGVHTDSPPKITVSMDLYDFGVPVHVEAPPAAEIIDWNDLENGGFTSGTLAAPS